MQNYIHSDDLYHWGIKGMRWGVRRYQNKDGSLTPAGKKRYGDDPDNSDSDDNDTTMDRIEARKRRTMETGDVKTAYKNRSYYSDDELRQVINRYNLEKQMKDITDKDVVVGESKIQKMQKTMDKTVSITTTGINLYNNIAKISNAFTDKDLPIIGEKKKNKGGTNTPP